MAQNEQKITLVENRKAYHDFEVLVSYEAGIVLEGHEVKSMRLKQCSLKGNFVHEWKNELWLEGLHITPYKFATQERVDPVRKRKLLLKRKEIIALLRGLREKGNTCVALEVFVHHNLMKVKIALVRGKKLHDKRATLKQKEENRTIARTLKLFSRG